MFGGRTPVSDRVGDERRPRRRARAPWLKRRSKPIVDDAFELIAGPAQRAGDVAGIDLDAVVELEQPLEAAGRDRARPPPPRRRGPGGRRRRRSSESPVSVSQGSSPRSRSTTAKAQCSGRWPGVCSDADRDRAELELLRRPRAGRTRYSGSAAGWIETGRPCSSASRPWPETWSACVCVSSTRTSRTPSASRLLEVAARSRRRDRRRLPPRSPRRRSGRTRSPDRRRRTGETARSEPNTHIRRRRLGGADRGNAGFAGVVGFLTALKQPLITRNRQSGYNERLSKGRSGRKGRRMLSRKPWLSALVLALVTGLLVVGCGGGDEGGERRGRSGRSRPDAEVGARSRGHPRSGSRDRHHVGEDRPEHLRSAREARRRARGRAVDGGELGRERQERRLPPAQRHEVVERRSGDRGGLRVRVEAGGSRRSSAATTRTSCSGSRARREYNACEKNCDALRDKVAVKATDDQTLEVTLTSTQPWFIQQSAHSVFLPVHQATVEQFGERWTRPENIVTNGPFKVEAAQPSASITLVKDHGVARRRHRQARARRGQDHRRRDDGGAVVRGRRGRRPRRAAACRRRSRG